jgi:hypothetical protein
LHPDGIEWRRKFELVNKELGEIVITLKELTLVIIILVYFIVNLVNI